MEYKKITDEERLSKLEKKFGVTIDKIRDIELNLIAEFISAKALTLCSRGSVCTGGCPPGQDCKQMQYNNCYCVAK